MEKAIKFLYDCLQGPYHWAWTTTLALISRRTLWERPLHPLLTLNLGSEDVIYYVCLHRDLLWEPVLVERKKMTASRRKALYRVPWIAVLLFFQLTIHYNSPHRPATALARLNQTDRVWCRFWYKAPVTLIYKWAKGASCPCQGEVHNEGHIRGPVSNTSCLILTVSLKTVIVAEKQRSLCHP